MNKLLLYILSVIYLCLSTTVAAQQEKITLYSYHNHPPFVTGINSGLTYELAKQLNKQASGRYLFEVSIIPRSRLNHYLKDWIHGACPNSECKQNWLVPWVNPKWGFIRGSRDNYLWHQQFTDANVIISRANESWNYISPASLKGLVFAGMRGHHYVGIDDLVKTGDIKRIDGNRERDNLFKLLHRRVDATLLPRSTMAYFLENDPEIKEQAEQFKIGNEKHHVYIRHIMLPETRSDLLSLIKNMPLKEPSTSNHK
jgi:polar amino acid transport system substrate-binding protein